MRTVAHHDSIDVRPCPTCKAAIGRPCLSKNGLLVWAHKARRVPKGSEPKAPPRPSRAPCGTCPYRRDVPAGIWAATEYAKLPAYDAETWQQPMALFYCHQNDGHLCAGWVGCHDTDHLLSMRINRVDPSCFEYKSPVPLFASGSEAAAHGLSGVDRPDDRALRAVHKLERKRGML